MEEKAALRRRMRAWRDALGPEELARASAAVARRLFSLRSFRAARTVLFYVSFRSEVDTVPMIRRAIALGKAVCAPQTLDAGGCLVPRRVADPDRDLVPGFSGIPEPDPARAEEVPPGEIDVVVVPGLAFDRRGYRLGYGRGFYDRFLAALPAGTWRIGLCLEGQVVDALPRDPWDVPMHRVVTEARVIRCAAPAVP